MAAKIDRRLKVKNSPVTGKRTDRVKKAERDRMVKLREKDRTVEQIALTLNRSVRTVSKQLKKAGTSERTSATLDPLILQRKAEHFAYMAEIANGLLTTTHHQLDSVRVNPHKRDPYGEYVWWPGDDAYPVGRKELSACLQKNMDVASGREYLSPEQYESLNDPFAPPLPEFKTYPEYDFECLMVHLVAQLEDDSPEVASKGLARAIKTNPYELIELLRTTSRRNILKGKCEVCKDW